MYKMIHFYWKSNYQDEDNWKSTLSIHPALVINRQEAQFLNVVILIVVGSRPNNHIQLYIMDGHSKHGVIWNDVDGRFIFTNNKCFQWIFHDHVPFSPPPSPVVGSNVWWVVLQYCTLGPLSPWPTWFVVTLLSNIYRAAIAGQLFSLYIFYDLYPDLDIGNPEKTYFP